MSQKKTTNLLSFATNISGNKNITIVCPKCRGESLIFDALILFMSQHHSTPSILRLVVAFLFLSLFSMFFFIRAFVIEYVQKIFCANMEQLSTRLRRQFHSITFYGSLKFHTHFEQAKINPG